MALPWLIGAAVVGVVSYAAKKSKEEEEAREREERRERRAREEQRERERAAKALEDRKEAICKEYIAQGEEQANDFKQLLNGIVVVQYTQEPAFCASLLYGGRQTSTPFTARHKSDFLDSTTQKHLNYFETMYQVDLQPSTSMSDALRKISLAEEKLTKLKAVRQQLECKRNQLSN